MQSTDHLFTRLCSSVDTTPTFLADGFRNDSSAPGAGCSSSSLVIARQRRLNAKEKLLQDFDQDGVEHVHVCVCGTKCPAAMDVVPVDVQTDTLVFRSRINHSKNALAKVEEEDAPHTPRNMASINIYHCGQVGNRYMYTTRLQSARVEHQVSEPDNRQWDLKPWAFRTVMDSTTTAVRMTTAGDDTTRTGDRTTTGDNTAPNVKIIATHVVRDRLSM